ncbi:MAG: hypothetical protein KDA61_13920, partial [Planctomycetales bacterium]|nr:hypothetical protein [Planctomycetales bacterium]
MSQHTPAPRSPVELRELRREEIAARWRQFEGEQRANLIRLAALATFYLLHLWRYATDREWFPEVNWLELAGDQPLTRRFHLLATLLTVAWACAAAVIHMSLRRSSVTEF